MKSKCKLLLSTITAATILAGSLVLPHPVNVQAALNPLTNLELNDGEITGTTVKLRGWALNESGIQEIDVYVDGKYVTCLYVNKAREDVNEAHPGYKGGDISGYEDSIQVTPGKHTIRAYAIGNNKQVVYKEATINAKDLEAKTFLELSNYQSFYNTPLYIRGWALNPKGTAAVDVYIDYDYVKTLKLDEARPDVIKAFPEYKDQPGGGFNYKVPNLKNGVHTIGVYYLGSDLTAYSYKEVKIYYSNFLGSKMHMELEDNQLVGNTVNVRGWAINDDEIKAVDIYVDGKYTKTVAQNEFEVRPDVIKAFPQYADCGNKDKCGFDYKLQLSKGKHNIKAYAINEYNSVIAVKEVNVVSQY